MPEGDVVFRAAERLRAALAGETLTRSDFRVPRYATVDLRGQVVDSVASYGKHLFVRTETVSIHTHLKMEGTWRVFHCGQRWTKPRVAARLVLGTAEVEAVGFDLGLVEVLRRADEHTAIDHLGPDLLAPDWDPALAVERLAREPDIPIGQALLDQRNLAGIGNIYRSEICYLRKIHPARPVAAVDDLLALVNESHRVLYRAAHQPPWRALVYGRARCPCRRCGTAIRVELLGETAPRGDRVSRRERGIYYCPKCQVLPE